MNNNFPDIVFEDNDYLVINKPAGLAVHGGGNIKEETLADLLIARYPEIIKVGDDEARPGIVHRLDKEVSGLMVIAKNNNSFDNLKEQFKKRDINKQYLALAYGKVINDEGEINFPIKRSSEGYKMAAMPLNAVDLLTRHNPKSRDTGNIAGVFKAKEAITLFKVKARFINYTFLEVKIKTGRTHQIRVHFFAYGHPLVGDNLYCTKKTKTKNEKINLGRIFLMASQLS
ncbi:MAG TPA: RNA pseudouridine synthase, partial [Candidatus Saccharimonadales bacterium]|nr:RNA pseudouridine synthase [Candidatus Saccharimonadales bacterium]